MLKNFICAVSFFISANAFSMDDLLIYYGYLNSFNSEENSWVNDDVVADIGGKYDIVVFGDGIQNPSHPDYSNSQYIISELKSNYPALKIFGYVSVDQPLQDFQSKASQWDTLKVHGIFGDEMGYDFGPTRADQNARIQFVRELNYATLFFANAWKIDHVLGTVDDPSYPNSTYNPSATESLLGSSDYYLLESFVLVHPNYESFEQYMDRGDRARLVKASYPIKLAAGSILDDDDANGQQKFDRYYKGCHLFSLDACGSSDLSYGASSADSKFWTRPSVSHL